MYYLTCPIERAIMSWETAFMGSDDSVALMFDGSIPIIGA